MKKSQFEKDYINSHEDAISFINSLKHETEYEVLDFVSNKWKKQKYMFLVDNNEQEQPQKMIHWFRMGWIKQLNKMNIEKIEIKGINIHEGIYNTHVFIENEIVHVKPTTPIEQLPTWDDVRKAIELARKEVKVPYEVRDGHTIIDYSQYSEEEIIEQLKQSKNK